MAAQTKMVPFPVASTCPTCGRICPANSLSECNTCGKQYCRFDKWYCPCDPEPGALSRFLSILTSVRRWERLQGPRPKPARSAK